MPSIPTAALPVAVIGVGFLGRPLACALPAPVLAVSRTGTWPEEPVPKAIQLHAADLVHTKRGELERILAPARSLVICVAAGRAQDRRAVYLDGLTNLLDACSGQRFARIVYTSSTSALPDHDGWIDDDCPDLPASERGQIQRSAEQILRTTCEARNTPWVILRLAGLYGPDRELFRLYRADPDAIQPGDGMQATNLIHRDDAVQACLAALALDPTHSAVVNVCDDDHRPRRAMFAALARVAGQTEPRWQLPPASDEPHGKRVRNDRMKLLLGLRLRHPAHALPDLSPET
ncbi:MAG: NAD-dependent epimerase/dehydratase family protein [Nannocystis sp.]|nr:NAD-dependent epimerase/dehydratase family protein [Nannocystis sp.]MBA3548803.1 NAD-dependent epimerase/dehydratase family protein [Nannocystis sp.]